MICHNKESSLKSLTACCVVPLRATVELNRGKRKMLQMHWVPWILTVLNNIASEPQSRETNQPLVRLTAAIAAMKTASSKLFFFGFRCSFQDLYGIGSRIMEVGLSALMLAHAQLWNTFRNTFTKKRKEKHLWNGLNKCYGGISKIKEEFSCLLCVNARVLLFQVSVILDG